MRIKYTKKKICGKKICGLAMIFFMAAFISCAGEKALLPSAQEENNTFTLELKEFFSASAANLAANTTGVDSSSTNPFTNPLGSNKTVHLRLKKLSGELVLCGNETIGSGTCSEGTYKFSSDLLQNNVFSIFSREALDVVSEISMQVYEDGALTHFTRNDDGGDFIPINNDFSSSLYVVLHLYPNQKIELATAAFSKQLAFSLNLSDTATEVLAKASINRKIKGALNCPVPGGNNQFDSFEVDLDLVADENGAASLSSPATEYSGLYVGLPCTFGVYIKEGDKVLVQGEANVTIDDNPVQRLSRLDFDTSSQVFFVSTEISDSNHLAFTLNVTELQNSLRSFLQNDSFEFQYKLRLTKASDEVIDLAQSTVGSETLLKGNSFTEYSEGENINVTLEVYRSGDTAAWLSSSQNAQVVGGKISPLSAFLVRFIKTLEVEDVRTRGELILTVTNSNGSPAANLAINLTSLSTGEQKNGMTDARGNIAFNGIGNSLAAGEWIVSSAPVNGYHVAGTSFTIAENQVTRLGVAMTKAGPDLVLHETFDGSITNTERYRDRP